MKLRPRQLAFLLASLCVIGALAAVTIQSLRLERNELRSRAIAEHEASVRLVLWRMDSMLAPILAREAATPYYYYRPFFEANRTNDQSRDAALVRSAKSSKVEATEITDALIPSPLLQSDSKLVNLYFEVDDGRVRSPQAPEGLDRKLAESNFISTYRIETNIDRLNRLEAAWNRSQSASQTSSQTLELQQQTALASDGAGQTLAETAMPPAPITAQSAAPPPAADIASSRAAGTEGTPTQTAQLNNDYAQRAQVAANSKLTQLEAERSGSQWRRSDATSASEEPAPADEQPQNAKPLDAESDDAPKPDKSEQTGAFRAPPGSAAPSSDPPASRSAPHAPTEASRERYAVSPAPSPSENLDIAREPADVAAAPDFNLNSVLDQDASARRTESPSDPIQGPLEPRWLAGTDEPTLVLVRQVTTSGGPITQGLWLNWPELRGALLELASDVFPSATIDPLPGGVANLPPEALNRCLATIPAELRVPEPSIPAPRVYTPVRVALSMAWIVALGAIAASGLALRSATELADRRGQFVSAVTHELRTPLTTFCLYSQMLADGMVRDADAQAQYHSTLHRESQRLTRIVESVLEYARLGKRKAHAKPEATSVGALLDASLPALRERCQACGLELVDTREGDAGSAIRVDRATFDRILSNLVDNACKYAAGSDPARVELFASVSASSLEVRVRDFGPGIPPTDARRIFDPFFRGSAHSDGATPGLGLGLALCKALAREMGGDLSLIQPSGASASGGSASGACFRLVLPRNA